ncbi:MAG TPA: enolase C-terminal domain-like protein [Patescibacteria group bacterium]|nr:enolase C-terminal domain-like protein [Patescibacteria group bacterium]
MKIKNIQAVPVKLRLKEPFRIANVTMYDIFYVVVKVETDNGIVGFGEAAPAWEVTGETWQSVVACVNLFTQKSLLGFSLIGQPVNDFEEIQNLINTINPISGLQLIASNSSAKAAIEQAILDIYGKYKNQPIYSFFGGNNKRIPFTKNISIFPIKETIKKVQEGIDDGANIIRLKIGLPNFDGNPEHTRDIEVINKTYELISQKKRKIMLVADANQGFKTVAQAAVFCKKIEGKLDWLEQPVLAGNLLSFKQLKAETSIPLMADESMNSYSTAEMLLDLGCVDFLNIKLMKTGGIIAALKIIALAKKYNVKCQIGSMIESQLGTAMGCQLYMCDDSIISTDLNSFNLLSHQYASGLELDTNLLHLKQNPGTGVTVNMKMVDEYKLL